MAKKQKASGYVLHHDTENHVVVIVTGVHTKSANSKTGSMLQIWILRDDVNPIAAVKSGLDAAICFDCPHRGNGVDGAGRSCYVNIGQAPLAVFKKFQRAGYEYLPESDYAQVFAGRVVRFGAYGEPVLIPRDKMAAIVSIASKHTGYTHQWRNPEYAWIREYVMASCDSIGQQQLAASMGWRTFRVSADVDPQQGEITCPASAEAGMKTQCERCALCSGASKQAKNITIQVHGSQASNALPKLIQISAN